MNITSAAWELDAIRNELAGSDYDPSELKSRCDKVGAWLASQKNGKKISKLLSEAEQVADMIEGGSGCQKSRIVLV